MTIATLLEHFRLSPYRLEVPTDFVAQFFNDRRLIVTVAREHLRSHGLLLKGVEHALRIGGTDLWGQSTIEENFALHSIVSLLKPKQAVEIGLFRGQTAVTINRALTPRDGRYTGIDIDADAIAIVETVLKRAELHGRAKLLQGDSASLLNQLDSVDFAFIDGDHDWNGVVHDVAAVYNKLTPGGVIAMHDVGTPTWGWTVKDPGRLLHETLPKYLAGHANLYWLDSMCREMTMRLLSPRARGEDSYYSTPSESFEKASLTVKDTVAGWGGLGFIHKLDNGIKLDAAKLLAERPEPIQLEPSRVPESRIRRLLNRCVQFVP